MLRTSFIDYLTLERNYATHTITAYQRDIDAFSRFSQATLDTPVIKNASYANIRAWIVALVEQNLSNRSINRKIAALKAYYKFLLKIGEIESSPLQQHKALKTIKKIQIPFSETEMATVLHTFDQVDTFEGVRDKLIIELLYATGIRRMELITLKISTFNTADNTLKVQGKRDKQRIIPLLSSVVETMNSYLAHRETLETIVDTDHLLLTKKGAKLSETLVYRLINNTFAKATSKVKRSPHLLRHTFATHLLNQGASIKAVKELLGHASLASTQIYTHSSMAHLRNTHLQAHPRSKKN